MRRLLILYGSCIALAFLMTGSGHAAVIKGRVVDSAGQPVAGAEVRLWRRGRQGGAPANQPVLFAGAEALRADDAGRFETPDVFDARTPVRIVAQAPGKIAGRSGWMLPSDDETDIDDIVLVGLRSIVGQVVDSQGNPAAGATVFNVDGHKRVETKTGSTGKFLLDEVPENALFLFAEKAGYRLNGILLSDGKSAELRITRSDEPLEPLRTHDSVLSDAERATLAHRLLDPYLDAVSTQGNDTDKNMALHELSMIDPKDALERVDQIGFTDRASKENCRAVVFLNWMKSQRAGEWDAIRAAIESQEDKERGTSWLIQGASYYMPAADRDRRREWLEQGLVRARSSESADRRVVYLANAAEGFWRVGDRERATAVTREAEAAAKSSPRVGPLSDYVVARLARDFAPLDVPAAVAWLDQIKNDLQFAGESSYVCALLAPMDAAAAEEVWNHISDRPAKDRSFLTVRDRYAADVCFRMANLDLDCARRIALTVEVPYWRVRARAAPALAVGGETARRVLQDAVADPELKAIMPQTTSRTPETVAIALASILPSAEGADPSASRELLWRALSLRPPQPTVGLLDDEALRADVALAQLVARYEPTIARALLEPAVERLPQLASPAEHAQKAMPVVVAAAYVDPNWAVEALDRLPEPPDVSCARHAKNATRMFLVRALALQGDEYWKHAGFWVPEE